MQMHETVKIWDSKSRTTRPRERSNGRHVRENGERENHALQMRENGGCYVNKDQRFRGRVVRGI